MPSKAEILAGLGVVEAALVGLRDLVEALPDEIEPPPPPPPDDEEEEEEDPEPEPTGVVTFSKPVWVTDELFERPMAWNQPQVAVDSLGSIFVLALQRRGRRNNVVWMSADQGQTWMNFGDVSNGMGDWNARAGNIMVDSLDRVHVIFYDSGTRHVVWHRRLDPDASGWKPGVGTRPTDVSRNSRSSNEHPTLVEDPNDPNHLLAAWDGGFYATSSDAGTTWSGTRSLGISLARVAPMILANGEWWYVGNSSIPKGVEVYRSNNQGMQWEFVTRLDDQARVAGYTSWARDSNDYIHLAWMADESTGTRPQIRYSCWDGAAWSEPQTVAPTPSRYQTFPSVAVDTQDMVHLAFHQCINWPGGYPDQSPGSQTFRDGQIWFTSRVLGQPWGPARRVTDGDFDQYPTITTWGEKVIMTFGRDSNPGDCMVTIGVKT